MKKPTRKQERKYNPVAKDLRTPKYRVRIKRAKSKYDDRFSLSKELDKYFDEKDN